MRLSSFRILFLTLSLLSLFSMTLQLKLFRQKVKFQELDIPLPACISSTFAAESVVSHIIHFQDKIFISNMDKALSQWSVINRLSILDVKIYQRNRHFININQKIDGELNFQQPSNIERFKASLLSQDRNGPQGYNAELRR